MNKFEKNKIRASVLSEAFESLEYRVNYAANELDGRKDALDSNPDDEYCKAAFDRAEAEFDVWSEIIKALEKLI